MKRRLALLALVPFLYAAAQTTLTVDQLVSFVKSSVQLGHSDRQVATTCAA